MLFLGEVLHRFPQSTGLRMKIKGSLNFLKEGPQCRLSQESPPFSPPPLRSKGAFKALPPKNIPSRDLYSLSYCFYFCIISLIASQRKILFNNDFFATANVSLHFWSSLPHSSEIILRDRGPCSSPSNSICLSR